jgi:hypothetical protein
MFIMLKCFYTINLIAILHIVIGGYVILQEKLPNYVVPDLTGFKVCIFHLFNFITMLPCRLSTYLPNQHLHG